MGAQLWDVPLYGPEWEAVVGCSGHAAMSGIHVTRWIAWGIRPAARHGWSHYLMPRFHSVGAVLTALCHLGLGFDAALAGKYAPVIPHVTLKLWVVQILLDDGFSSTDCCPSC